MKITLENAWLEAEKTSFSWIKRYTETDTTNAAFLGMMPLNVVNGVMFTSGGNSATTDIEVTRAADDNCWKVVTCAARVEIINVSREKALRWCGLIMQMLNDTDNLNETGNVMWLRATELPGEPEPGDLLDAKGNPVGMAWRIDVPLEMTYRTDAEY